MTRSMHALRTLIRSAADRLRGRTDHVVADGTVIPSPDRRWCGPEFKDDAFYLASAEREAARLAERFGCTTESRVLDIGCGQGRLAIGLARRVGPVHYLGLDIHRPSIEWCRRHIERHHPTFRFQALDVHNERYNPGGTPIRSGFRFDLPDSSIDIAYLYSVFSHMTETDMRAYLSDLRRLLAPGGGVFMTAFIEEGVPDISINPDGHRVRCAGPLHVVRYERGYFIGIVESLGYEVASVEYGVEADGQSGICLRHGGGVRPSNAA
jgi:SAM-dependent methyltransferase